jgi:hypothetical protein
MINYVYCSTNPEQKELAKGFCSYDFVKPVPIYDHYATGDFSKKTLAELTGTVIVQWAESILPVNDVAKKDWIFWVDSQYLKWINEGNTPRKVKYFANSYDIKRQLQNHKRESRALYRGGKVSEIRRKFLDFKKVRIGIHAGHMKGIKLKDIYDSLKESMIKDFELFVVGQGEYKLHQNTLIDSEIKQICPRINICNYSMSDMDVILITHIKAEAGINEALREGVPIAALPSYYAKDMEMKYGCLTTSSIDCIGDAVMKSVSDSIIDARKKMALIMNDENMSSLFRVDVNRIEYTSSKSQIDVFGLFRNNEETIGKTLSGLKAAERKLGKKANYYFFENDSTDDTPNQIKDFYMHSTGNYECQIMNAKLHGGTSRPDRLRDLALYRNNMKELCSDWDSSEYTFIVDSEIKFEHDIFSKMINVMESIEGCVMVTPYGTPEYNDEYYDTFALLAMDESKTPPAKIGVTEVKSAFAGFACIKTQVFKKCHWQPLADVSEHIFFCDMVRQYGKIVVDSSTKVTWKK